MTVACLTIAGFDPSAGAGVLADLETFARLGARGQAVITTVTAQNQSRVRAVHPLRAKRIREQAEALLEEGLPGAIKIGMLGSAAAVRQLARLLGEIPDVPVVLDPVFRASSGTELMPPAGVRLLKELLLPRATLVTPNLQEAGILLGRKTTGRREALRAAGELHKLGPGAVLLTGGHLPGPPTDILADRRGVTRIEGKRVPRKARGTGCRHSAALAVYLANGRTPRQAARQAHNYLRRYLQTRGT